MVDPTNGSTVDVQSCRRQTRYRRAFFSRSTGAHFIFRSSRSRRDGHFSLGRGSRVTHAHYSRAPRMRVTLSRHACALLSRASPIPAATSRANSIIFRSCLCRFGGLIDERRNEAVIYKRRLNFFYTFLCLLPFQRLYVYSPRTIVSLG